MDVLEAIHTRQSIGKVKSDPVDQSLIEQILELATRAPNHRHTEPWRFYVMTGAGREVLGNAYTDIALEKVANLTEKDRALIAEKQKEKAERAPVVIAVAAAYSSDDEIQQKEERAATHAAIENMLLAAHGLGLGAIWRTGEPAYHPRMREAFHLEDYEDLVGFVYIGYPDSQKDRQPRKPFSEVTKWLK
ncbi:nitroreductase [Pullulanibacillus sp. KACC 23026]|uniref:nitroreductase family protein n=1 Tax=Pullulanibacillus sp. KACC 23026 TaxID=3028315 RepID=UPI0023B15A96|nr:nitroreductase [Pullulanibacillus sp. KACC 23026]WEG12568.1 nitroreductase [Pullulanibacillus sp. KACC 23026]